MTDRPTTAILRSPEFLRHDTGDHVEHPSRVAAINRALADAGMFAGRPEPEFAAATFDQASRVHDPRYLEALATFAADGGGWIDGDTFCAPESFNVAMLAAGAAVAAVDIALDGEHKHLFTLGRPPGHHATATRAMGFCLINSVAVAAQHALDRGLQRVAIVDWDVHHGNGTQDIFYRRDDVLFCSVHRYGFFYPGSGAASERGMNAGEGFTINAPLARGADDQQYSRVFDEIIHLPVIDFNPELVLVSAGFDAHRDDPLGGMAVTEQGFARLAERVVRWADECGHGRVVCVLEGGYDLDALGRSVVSVLRTLDGSSASRYSALSSAPHESGAAGPRTAVTAKETNSDQ